MAKKPKSRAGIDDVMLMPISPSQQKKQRRLWVSGALVVAVLLVLLGGWLGAGCGLGLALIHICCCSRSPAGTAGASLAPHHTK